MGLAKYLLGGWAGVLLGFGAAFAGGGPENLALVVNADSWASKAVANEFVRLRSVPPAQVVYLGGFEDFERIDVEGFRSRILTPVLATLRQRGLLRQIDYLVYSSDLPYAVDVSADAAHLTLPKYITPTASLNGLTYLYQKALAADPAYLGLKANRYMRWPLGMVPEALKERFERGAALMQQGKWAEAAELFGKLARQAPDSYPVQYRLAFSLARLERRAEAQAAFQKAIYLGWPNYRDDAANGPTVLGWMKEGHFDVQTTLGFDAETGWDAKGRPADGGARYLLSTMLAITSGRGNSVDEAIASLRRAVSADGTRPQGTIYYVVNDDIRSRVRQPVFPAAVAHLRHLGVRAEILEGIVPQGKEDVQGAAIGIYHFDWQASGSRILPGAICEHMTSFGGVMSVRRGRAVGDERWQTPLTEFIRYGAAGASGAVVEPYAIQEKFPYPFLQVHYARGASLAEAYYQSVAGPYQLLIVGDPLCQPWAVFPRVEVEGLAPGQRLKRGVSLRPLAHGAAVGHFELFVDGRLQTTAPAGMPLSLEAAGLDGGYHEARVVAVGAGRVQTRGRAVLPFEVEAGGRAVELAGPDTVAWDRPLRLDVSAPGAAVVEIWHNGRAVARLDGAAGVVEIDPQKLGQGRARLQGRARYAAASPPTVRSRPFEVGVGPNAPLAGVPLEAEAMWRKGLLLRLEGGLPLAVGDTNFEAWLEKTGLRPGQGFELSGLFGVAREQTVQFQVRANMPLQVRVDKGAWRRVPAGRWHFIAVACQAGLHRLEVRGRGVARPMLDLRFGGPGTRRVGAEDFRYVQTASGPGGAPDTLVQTPAGTRHRMALVPAGPFQMGSPSGDNDEHPVHTVELDGYAIDLYEVSNDHFAAFLNHIGGVADRRGRRFIDLGGGLTRIERVDGEYGPQTPDDGRLPAVGVSWHGAATYCSWAGLRLPTEAEWEKAARGVSGQTYPWGEDIDRTRATYRQWQPEEAKANPKGPAAVDAFKAGVSPYGLHHMAGNVWEWVADYYDRSYYGKSPAKNPRGPARGSRRVVRGGSLGFAPHDLRAANRHWSAPGSTLGYIGFRCAVTR